MQVNFDTQNNRNNFYFGAIKTDRVIDSILWLRAKKPRQYNDAQSVVYSMTDSRVDANIYRQGNSNYLGAQINEHNGHGYVMKESFWNYHFCSPARFLAKVRAKMIEIEQKGNR